MTTRSQCQILNIWASHYEPTGGWRAAELGSANQVDAFEPEVAIDNDGRALLVWFEGCPASQTRTAHYEPGIGWSDPGPLPPDPVAHAYSPYVGFLPNGDAVALWSQGDTSGHIVARYYR